ncbi:unnamed protein product [Closterium sp. NIES-64]|nr:unnamed protein product [Closterium sp. NIES-64]CAI5959214.1 unnamed protein product [Closterium sp. NIES-65]
MHVVSAPPPAKRVSAAAASSSTPMAPPAAPVVPPVAPVIVPVAGPSMATPPPSTSTQEVNPAPSLAITGWYLRLRRNRDTVGVVVAALVRDTEAVVIIMFLESLGGHCQGGGASVEGPATRAITGSTGGTTGAAGGAIGVEMDAGAAQTRLAGGGAETTGVTASSAKKDSTGTRSTRMMDDFMRIVRHNTSRNLETCAVLGGVLKKGLFFIKALILPKQESTSDSCSTLNEEEIFEAQDKRGLFQLGWIHTHPSQACFMSSIDLHTHYSYQVMLPEAIAIVMAPKDPSRPFGIFQLSQPGGVKVIQNCQQRGFHTHEAPADGTPLYSHSSHVFFNPRIDYEVLDLR